jgi:hypothetical protein
MFKKIIMSSIIASGVLFAQSGIGININQNDLEIEGTLDSRNLAFLQTSSTIYLGDFNFINKDDNDIKSKLIGIGFGATNQFEGIPGVELTFGAKLILSDVDDDRKGIDDWFSAMPLMAMVRYIFPPLMYNIPPVSVEGKVLYAPSALTFGGDSDNYGEFRISGDMEMIENVKVYMGYRHIMTGYEADENYIFDNGFYGGLKFIY